MKLGKYVFPKETSAVFIDDTGSPGLQTQSAYLPQNRKTWIAVLLSPRNLDEVIGQMPSALAEMKKHFDVEEFHFADILSGRRKYEGHSLQKRLSIFAFMSRIFKQYKFPIFVQTFSRANILEHKSVFQEMKMALPGFDLCNPNHAAFWFLVLRVKKCLMGKNFKMTRSMVFADEGLKKAGTSYSVPGLSNEFVNGRIYFESSEEIFPIQLADFAAFCLNKTQLILTKKQISDLDISLLKIFESADFNFINIPKIKRSIDNYTPHDYDDFHSQNRILKGLEPHLPPEE